MMTGGSRRMDLGILRGRINRDVWAESGGIESLGSGRRTLTSFGGHCKLHQQ